MAHETAPPGPHQVHLPKPKMPPGTKGNDRKAWNEYQAKIRDYQKANFRKQLGRAKAFGLEDIKQYFSDRGITDLAPYHDAITKALRDAAQDVPNPATVSGVRGRPMHDFFDTVAEDLYNSESERKRTQAQTAIKERIPSGFEQDRITSDMDDAIIQEMLDEQRGKAEGYVKNLLDRGVINQRGYDAAIEDVLGQQPRIQGMLEDVGGNLLGGGRNQLSEIANAGKLRADQLMLNDAPFNADKYAQDIENAFSEFTGGFGNKFRAQVGQGDLFTTSQLAGKAGAAQGPQNFRFDPRALAGSDPLTEEEEDDDRKASIF